MPIPRFRPHLDHGQVFGIPGVAFDQEGQLYNSNHEPVTIEGKVITEEVAAAMPAPVPASPPAKAGKGKAKTAAPPPVDEDTPEDERALDLEGYIAGSVKYDFQTVKAYVAQETGEDPQTKDEVMDLINRMLSGEKFSPADASV